MGYVKRTMGSWCQEVSLCHSFCLSFSPFEIRSYHLVQAGLVLSILLLQPPEYRDDRHAPPHCAWREGSSVDAVSFPIIVAQTVLLGGRF